jgi:hypothetical protein
VQLSGLRARSRISRARATRPRSVLLPRANVAATVARSCRDSRLHTVAGHLADGCRTSVDGGHSAERWSAEFGSYGSRRAFGARRGVRMRPPAVHRRARSRCLSGEPKASPPAGASRLRDDGPILAGCSEWGRGASSRLPLSPVRTYQEPPEGPRSFVQRGAPSWPLWWLLIALRVG